MSTRTPLLLKSLSYYWCPLLLNLLVVCVLVFAFFGYILITGDSTNVKFIVFGGRIVLAFTVLIIQLISMYAIRRMIRKHSDLKFNVVTYVETMFIFLFFSVNVMLYSAFTILFQTFARK